MMLNLSKIRPYLQLLRIAANEYWPWRRQYKLVIVDDMFPQPISGFRMAEYTYYLKHIENSIVYSTGFAFKYVDEQRQLLEVISDFEIKSPEFAGRVLPFSRHRAPGAQLAYVMFLHNAKYFLYWFEKKPDTFYYYAISGWRV